MTSIYICAPYDNAFSTQHNIQTALNASRKIWATGALPITPHIYFHQFITPDTPRETILNACLKLLASADKLLLLTPDTITPGMQLELDFAARHNIPIIYPKDIP